MSDNLIQSSFSGGEWSKSLYARVDLAKYKTAAARLRNFFVDYRGGASTRPGTKYVGRCFPGINRLISFSFSTQQSYALLFSDLQMRVVKDGGMLLENGIGITGATQANPCVISTQTAHGYSNGDWVYLYDIEGMTQLNGRTCVIANTAASSFSLMTLDSVSLSATSFSAYTSGGSVARVYTLTSPYAASDLALLKFTQSADTMTLTHPSYAPRQLTRTGTASFSFTTITFTPSQSAPTNPSVTPSSAGSTTYRYVVTGVSTNGVTESEPSNSASTTASATMSLISGVFQTVAFTAATGAQYYNVYRQEEVPNSAAATGSLYGFVGSTTGSPFVDCNVLPDFTQTPPIAYNPFGSTGNYPGCTTYFEGRQMYAGSDDGPQSIWGSKPGDFLNMDYSNPSRASDAIQATLVAQQVNAIKHLVPMNSLLALTAGGAWKIDGGNAGEPLSPSTFNAKPQAYNGCSDVPPIVINYQVLYVQSKGSVVRDLSYNFYVNVFTGQDITPFSTHLFYGYTIQEWAYAEEPFKLVWAVRDDGVMLSLTYMKEQEVAGWAHSDTQGLFKSVCSVSEPPEDAVYVVVSRVIPGVNDGDAVQYVERMDSRNFLLQGRPEVALAWCVDCGLQYPLVYPAADCMPSGHTGTIELVASAPVFTAGMVGNIVRINGGIGEVSVFYEDTRVDVDVIVDLEVDDFGNDVMAMDGDWTCTEPVTTVTGLEHLEGAEVVILAGGNVDSSPQTVEDGAITLTHAQDIVTVGLAFVPQLQSLYMDISGVPTVQGKRKRIPAVTCRVENSRGLKVGAGPTFDTFLREMKERTTQNMGQPIPLISGDERINIDPQWQETGQVVIQQDYPLPSTILGLIPEVVIGDK